MQNLKHIRHLRANLIIGFIEYPPRAQAKTHW